MCCHGAIYSLMNASYMRPIYACISLFQHRLRKRASRAFVQIKLRSKGQGNSNFSFIPNSRLLSPRTSILATSVIYSNYFRHFDPYSTFLWASLVAQMIKESACNAEDLGSIPGLGRSPGGGYGNPLR